MKKGILVASFGTSYHETREKTIDRIVEETKRQYPEHRVLSAFTSGMIIRKLKERDGLEIPTPQEALERMRQDGITDIVIQSLHLIPGLEYEKLLALHDKVSRPLLYDASDYQSIAQALFSDRGTEDALLLMGHGSPHRADRLYDEVQRAFYQLGHDRVFIGTTMGSRTIDDIMGQWKAQGIRKVKMQSFMLVSGDHIHNDMASEEDGSWNRRLKEAGFEVEISYKALGEYPEIRSIFARHLADRKGE